MPDQALRIVLGDTHPESRLVLETICQEQGWQLATVESSFQILRMLRDAPDISLVMVDPTLPGSGISGRDLAKTIKTSAQFGAVRVMFVLHAGVAAPEGVPVDGTIEIDRAGPARLLAAIREAMSGTAGARPGAAELVEGAPRAVAAPAATVAAVVSVPVEAAAPVHSARILVADAVVTSRMALEPICERHGWELITVESGFQALRIVRDTDVNLVLINPHLQAAGVSGADIARTIKSAAQFRKLPVLFLLHQGEAAPEGAKVDGVVEVDAWPAARLASALNAAMGHAADVEASAPGARPSPSPASAHAAASADEVAKLREDLLTEVRRTIGGAVRAFVQAESRTIAEDAIRHYTATEGRGLAEQVAAIARETLPAAVARLERHDQALAALKGALAAARRGGEGGAGASTPSIEPVAAREGIEAAVRLYLADEGRPVVEQIVAALAREMVPAIAEGRVAEEFRAQMLDAARGAAEAASQQQVASEGRAVLDAAVRRYLASEGRGLVEGIVERLVRQELERLPSPAARVDEATEELRAQMLDAARGAAEAASQQQVASEGRAVLDAAVRRYLASEGRGLVEGIVERLVRQELERLPSPAARVDEATEELRAQMLDAARGAAEAASQQQVASEGRAVLDAAVRQYFASEGRNMAEALVAVLAREVVPAIAQRLVQQEFDRVPSVAAKIEELVPELRAQLREDARRVVEAMARHYAETDGRAAVENLVREHAASQGVEDLIRVVAREQVPAIAEGLVQQELERLPNAATKIEELLVQLREHLREDARRAVEMVARQFTETDGRGIVESVIRQYVATEGVGLADDFVRAATREILPPIAERLVQRELARTPAPAVKIEEVLPQLREQLREEGRRAIEIIARRYAETEGRSAIESAIRHHVSALGTPVVDDFVRAATRELLPAIAERVLREEVARLRREFRLE